MHTQKQWPQIVFKTQKQRTWMNTYTHYSSCLYTTEYFIAQSDEHACHLSKTYMSLVKNSKPTSGIINKANPNQIKLPTSDI